MLSKINGILLLDKPQEATSNHALQRVKRLFRAKKAGHTGSLDPIATGMLPICFGEATKFSQFLLESNKTYDVVARLGVTTTTGDSEGAVVAETPVTGITEAVVNEVLKQFQGHLEQIPPMYSAIKFQGRPLYELARRGIEIERKPRSIQIFSTELHYVTEDSFSFNVHCTKGTYVRTLVEDIGKVLGCGAHVIGLRRQSVYPYDSQHMYSFEKLESILESAGIEALQHCLLPVESAVQIYPMVKLSNAAAFYLRMGQPVRASQPLTSAMVRLMSEEAKFLGVGEVMPDGRVKPHRLVSQV